MMTVTQETRVVIIGAGQAGVEAAAALRMSGFTGPIVMIGEEPGLPYSRPPLSKGFLTGDLDEALLYLRSAEQLAEQGIELIEGRQAVDIDRSARSVMLDDGATVDYDYLVLATGGAPRRLSTPELLAASNVLTLRTIADAAKLRSRLQAGSTVVIIGGGFIGLEIAAAARRAGVRVTVLEAGPRVLARVTSPVMSEFYQRVHAEEGVEIIVDARIEGYVVTENGDISQVTLEGGRRVPADFVLLGVGLAPRTELAEKAGLAVDNGILVDEAMQTLDSHIFAVGDVARHPDPQHGGLRRLESVPNAAEQARCVAGSILGAAHPYDALPWFWSDQYDIKLQIAGLAQGYDVILVRGDATAGRQFTVLYLRGDVLVAADVVNKPADFAACRRLIVEGTRMNVDLLRDVTIPLKSCVAEILTA